MDIVRQIMVTYAQVLTFKRSPKETPNSGMLLVFALLFAFFFSLLQVEMISAFELLNLDLLKQTMYLALNILMFIGFVLVIFWYQDQLPALKQYLTVWFLFAGFLDLCLCLLLLILMGLQTLGLNMMFGGSMILVITLLFSFWSLVFMIYLFRLFICSNVWTATFLYLLWVAVHYGIFYSVKFVSFLS